MIAMIDAFSGLRPRRWAQAIGWALLALLALAACRPAGDTPAADGTTAAEAPGIVTRIVEQITFVTSTPDPAQPPPVAEDPVVLGVSLCGELPDLDPRRAESEAQLDLAQNLFVGLTNFNPETNVIEP